MSELTKEAKGKYNETVGNLTHDQSQQAKGKMQVEEANASNAAQDTTQNTEQAVNNATNSSNNS